jgi:hypothetical protein
VRLRYNRLQEDTLSEKIEHVEWWLNYAYKELEGNPTSSLSYFVTENIASSHSGWQPTQEIFSKPEGLDETLLRLGVCSILKIALTNAIELAKERMQGAWSGPPCCSWKAMDISFAFILAEKVATFDPLCAVRAKIQLNMLSQRVGESLYSIANSPDGIFLVPDVGIDW